MKIAYNKEKKRDVLKDIRTGSQMNKTNLQILLEMFENGVFEKDKLKGRGLLFSDIERIINEAVKATQKEDLERFNKKTESLQKHNKNLKAQLKEKNETIDKLNQYVDDLKVKLDTKTDIFKESLTEYMKEVKDLKSEIINLIKEGGSISVAEIDRLSKPLLDRPSIEDSKVFIDPTESRDDLDPHISIGTDSSESDSRDVSKDLDKLRKLVKKKDKKGD